ncbi:MAG: sensor histidine kinase [Caulobacter sp.]|jgi:signal transduction histidine kinase
MTPAARQPQAIPEPEATPRARRDRRRQDLADAHKKSFLRMVSHELRTPLNAVIGFSEILSCELYGPLGAPQYKQYAEHIRQSGLKLLSLVNQILEIARLEGDQLDLDLRPEPLDHALEDVLTPLAADLERRSLAVAIEDEAGLPRVLADARGLRTMLGNLLQNAVDWSPDGGVVTVSATRRDSVVEIAIADQGPGVDPDDIPRLLRPFEQGENALTRTGSGAGLGLPIVQLLARAGGGQLRIASAPGQGLTATLVLPAV